MASPLDFSLSPAGELPAGKDQWPGSAYCLNLLQQRVLFAICPETDALLEAPFFWQAQYQQASHIGSIPFERLYEFLGTLPQRPIFVFSIGRCGSTLLSHLLRACGAHSISEPDLLTQLARPAIEQRKLGRPLRRLLIESCVASLTMQRAKPLAIKLRSQCNGIAREIAEAFPDGAYVVLMREPRSWFRSRLRTLGGNPKDLASIYRSGLHAFHELQSLGVISAMVWYEDLMADPVSVVRRLMGDTPSVCNGISDIRSVLNADSQAGTALEKDNVRRRGPTPEQVQMFEEEWEKIRPDLWIETYQLDRLRTAS